MLKALNTATSGATTNVGKLSDAVGLYAIPTFLNLVKAADGSVDSLQALAEKYNDVGGAAYEMQKRMENALAVDWDKANAAISAIKTELFLMYGGDLRQFVQDMTAWIRALADSKDTLREVISLMKDLLVTVGQVTAAIIGLSMVKGAANFAGSAVAAYKGVKEAAATRVAPAAVGMAEGMANGAILATAAATASTRDITAVTAATRGAAEATTMWAAAKKVLGVAFRAVPYIGTALILKDMYDIYQGLNVVVPKQADEVNQLADAQRRLNETFKGFRFSKANEGYTIDVAKTKRSLDELGASLEATQNKILDVEGQIDRALQAGIQDPARMRLLSEELGKLRKQYVALLQEAEAGETKLSRTAHTLIAKEREALTQQAINLERLRDQAQQAYDRALAEMNKKSVIAPQGGDQELAKYRKQYEEMNGLDFLSNGLGFNATFEEYLRKVNPALATLEKNLSDAKAALLKANREAETFNANLKTQENALDATENSLGAYNLTIKDTAKSLAYSQKLTAFFEGQAAAIRKVREESELENKTTQEKMSYYQQQIDHYDTIKKRMESLQGYAVELTRLIALYEEMDAQNGEANLPGPDQAQLDYFRQQLAGLESAFGWLKANEGARLGWETSMAGLGETTDDTTKAVEELRQSLWDLLNLPNEMDFTKTLKGQVDFAIAQADALLAKYAKLSGEYAGLPARGAVGSPSSGGGTAIGGGYSALNQSQQSYVTKVASALSMKDAAKEVLAQALPAIDKYSQKYNVSREEVIALITAENRDWNTRAANPKSSAYGLGQILEGTRKDISAAIKRPFAELTDSIDGQIEATVYYYSQRTQGKSSFGGAVSEWHSGPGGYPGGAKGAAQAKEGAELVSRANRALSALSGIDKALGNFADTGGGYGRHPAERGSHSPQEAGNRAESRHPSHQGR